VLSESIFGSFFMDSRLDVREVYVSMTKRTSGQTGSFVCNSWLRPTPEEASQGKNKQSRRKKESANLGGEKGKG
jgi:hypothetical protein